MATSFNGPLKVYQRVNPTNDGSGNSLVPNAGAVPVVQPFTYLTGGATETLNIARIPAGSQLLDLRVYLVTGATLVGAGSVNVSFVPDGGSAIVVGTVAVPATAANSASIANITWTATAAATINNVGSVAGYLQFGPESIASGTTLNFGTQYIIRNTDGTITNTGANLSNN